MGQLFSMGTQYSVPTDKHIVIVGGGYAGLHLASALLDANANFTLISARDSMHHNVASVRAAVEPGFSKKTLIPLQPMLGEKFKLGKVVRIDPKTQNVVLEFGEEIKYDILILATGSKGDFPNKIGFETTEAVVNQYDELCSKVAKAKKIVVVGGGATGVEQAAEIAYKYPDTDVTIIHGSDRLVNKRLNDKFQDKLRGILDRYGIHVVYGERVSNIESLKKNFATNDEPLEVVTDKGTKLQADLVFTCSGLQVNSEAYKDGLEESMNEIGQLKVNEFLQVEGFENIFAVGDCNAVPCNKLAFIAGKQADVVMANLRLFMNDKAMKPYDPSIPVEVILCMSPESGLGQTTGGWIIPEFISKHLKSGGMFIDKYWQLAKQQVPSPA